MQQIKALIIDTPHIDNILSGKKIWEMRTDHDSYRGVMGLIRKGHRGKIIGVVEMIDSIGPFATDEEMLVHESKHLMTPERLKEPDAKKYRHAWVLRNAKRLEHPISCEQTSQVIWVKLDEETSAAVMKAAV
jgi:hypothetical protein